MKINDIYYLKSYKHLKQSDIFQNNFSILQKEIIGLQKQLNKEKKIRRKKQWTKRKYI